MGVTTHAVPNITNLVTIRLSSPEDYLTWHTQFLAVLISQVYWALWMGLLSLLLQLSHFPQLSLSSGESTVNTSFQDLLRLDHSVRSWLFATLSPNGRLALCFFSSMVSSFPSLSSLKHGAGYGASMAILNGMILNIDTLVKSHPLLLNCQNKNFLPILGQLCDNGTNQQKALMLQRPMRQLRCNKVVIH